jgi:hypothetical protein
METAGWFSVRMIQKVFLPIRDFEENFVDDIAAFTEDNWDIHLEHNETLLQTIKKCGLTLTLKKSNFAMSEVKFCGHIVGSGKRRVDPDKAMAVKELKGRKQNHKFVRCWAHFHASGNIYLTSQNSLTQTPTDRVDW